MTTIYFCTECPNYVNVSREDKWRASFADFVYLHFDPRPVLPQNSQAALNMVLQSQLLKIRWLFAIGSMGRQCYMLSTAAAVYAGTLILTNLKPTQSSNCNPTPSFHGNLRWSSTTTSGTLASENLVTTQHISVPM